MVFLVAVIDVRFGQVIGQFFQPFTGYGVFVPIVVELFAFKFRIDLGKELFGGSFGYDDRGFGIGVSPIVEA